VSLNEDSLVIDDIYFRSGLPCFSMQVVQYSARVLHKERIIHRTP